jgi:phosphomannomutase
MKFNPKIFKAYDIRGKVGEDIDNEFAYKLGRAYATLIKNEVKKDSISIVVGYDMRESSEDLAKALTDGLLDEGLNVVNIGLVSTPTFYYAVAKYGNDGGVMVTASHNPKEYNGFKMTRAKAGPVSGEKGIFEIRDMVGKDDFKKTGVEKGKVVEKNDVLQEQVQEELKSIDVKKIKPLKVVADAANGMGAQYLEELFKHLPCKLTKMYFELDGSFPNHEADPLKDETMDDLKKKVLEEKADLGIATDGDGDRVFFVTNDGKSLYQPITRGLMAQSFLKDSPGATVAYDIRPGKITRDMIVEAGGKPVVTRVGHSLIKEKVIETNAIFAGESSGHFFVKNPYGVYETPMIVILKMLEIISEKNKPLSEIIKPYEKYFASGEINSVVEDTDAKLKEIEEKYSDGKINKMDGITIEYPDFWFNVRPSNTEPKLRLNLEAVSKEVMQEKRDEVLKVIRG